jgi:hypothetical protein
MATQAAAAKLASPAVDFFFIERMGPAGARITVGIECGQCGERLADTMVGDRVSVGFVDKAIAHSKELHAVSFVRFRIRSAEKRKFL